MFDITVLYMLASLYILFLINSWKEKTFLCEIHIVVAINVLVLKQPYFWHVESKSIVNNNQIKTLKN